MEEQIYEFDPCSLDDHDEDDEEFVSIDTWKPHVKKPKLVQSNWRKELIGNNFNQEPNHDDLIKIQHYLKKKFADSEIMTAFGISAEILVAIKKGKYDPLDGIALDTLSKIHYEFDRLQEKIDKIIRGMHYISREIFVDKNKMQAYKASLKKPLKEKVGRPKKQDKSEEPE